ncbi:MAG: M1 family metallopeptidase [Kofleriaceae bacterium]
MKALVAVAIVVGCTPAGNPAPVTPKPPPVEKPEVVVAPTPVAPLPIAAGDDAPKLRLPRLFTPQSYAARLTIDPDKPTFTGHIEITGALSTASSVIWLHGKKLTITKATATGSAMPIDLHVTPRGDDQLEIQSEAALPPGTYVLAFDYTGEIEMVSTAGAFAEKVDGKSYVFSQFEALYARRVFPCIDEPDSKVPWQLTLDVPKGDIAVSNTGVTQESEAGGHHVFEFAQTKPLPSYLVAFGVGPFEIVPAGTTDGGVQMRMIVPKGKAAEAAYAAKTGARVVSLLEKWFGIPYPYPKLDVMVLPVSSGFGAMENAGLITMDGHLMLMDAKASATRHSVWISVLAHEGAHQWFGDLVTTAWWDDIWLNEGFATWIEEKITAQYEPSWHWDEHEGDTVRAAISADSITTARQIRQKIDMQGDVLNAFDTITYQKGASVLNMFERFVGADKFKEGVRQYLKDRSWGNATSADFVGAISKAAGRDLAPAFSTFLDQPGVPELKMTVTCGAKPKLELAQRRFVPAGSATPGETKPWMLPVCIAYDDNGKRSETCTLLDAPKGELALSSCPRWVMPNVDARGYYRTDYTAKQVTALRDEAWAQLSWSERRSLFSDVNTSAQEAPRAGTTKLPLVIAVSLFPKMMQGDRFPIGQVGGNVSGFIRFASPDQRSKLEAWLRMTFGPGALKVGLAAKDTDDLDTEGSRYTLVSNAAIGKEPEIVKQGLEAAGHWRDLPESERALVLAIALDNSPEFAAKLVADLKTEKSRDLRATMLGGFFSVQSAQAYATALPILLDPAVDIRETMYLLVGFNTDASRAESEKFYLANRDALLKRMPADATTGAVTIEAGIFASSCDPKTRDHAVESMAPLKDRPGGARIVTQATEDLDQCIATRVALEPEIRGFLGGVKIPKPPENSKKDSAPKAGKKKSKH